MFKNWVKNDQSCCIIEDDLFFSYLDDEGKFRVFDWKTGKEKFTIDKCIGVVNNNGISILAIHIDYTLSYVDCKTNEVYKTSWSIDKKHRMIDTFKMIPSSPRTLQITLMKNKQEDHRRVYLYKFDDGTLLTDSFYITHNIVTNNKSIFGDDKYGCRMTYVDDGSLNCKMYLPY